MTGGLDSYDNFLGDDSDYQDWFVAPLGQSRDSDCLERSNFEVGLALLGGESETVRVERYGHWACGWVEQVYVKPGSQAVELAEDIEENVNTCCAITMEPDEVLVLIDKLKSYINEQ